MDPKRKDPETGRNSSVDGEQEGRIIIVDDTRDSGKTASVILLNI